MIPIIQRYIAKTVLMTTILVLIVVTGLAFFITLLTELKEIGVGDYTFMQAVLYVLLRLPYSIYQFFPMLALVGGVMGLGILSANRELIVMRTSGVSIYKVITSVLMAALILILFASFMGEYIGPYANYIADKRKDSEQNSGQAVATAAGIWLHEGNNFLHIEKVIGLDHLEGVTRYEFDPFHRLLAAYFAPRLDYDHGRWHAYGSVKTTFMDNRTQSQRFQEDTWNLSLSPNLLNVGIIAPEEMSLRRLARYSEHLIANKTQSNNFQFEFWKRIFQPLMTLVMILLAIPFVFGAPRSVTMGWRILFGVLVGFVFYILNAIFGQFSAVYQLSPFIAALLPTLLFAGLGYLFLMRVR